MFPVLDCLVVSGTFSVPSKQCAIFCPEDPLLYCHHTFAASQRTKVPQVTFAAHLQPICHLCLRRLQPLRVSVRQLRRKDAMKHWRRQSSRGIAPAGEHGNQ